MNEPEYERSFDANDELDQHNYVWYLWAEALKRIATREREVQGQQSLQQSRGSTSTGRKPKPVQQTETFWWNAKTGQRSKPSTTKRVPVSLLRATGTKAADWTKRQSPEPRKRKVKGTGKGPREVALFGLREGDQSNRTASGSQYNSPRYAIYGGSLRDYRDHKDY